MTSSTAPTRFADLYSATCDQKTKTIPVVVPFGTSVEAMLADFHAEGFFLEGAPVAAGVTDAGAVVLVTLKRTSETAALVRGIDSLISLADELPKAEKRLAEIHSGTESDPQRAALYRTLYDKMKANTLRSADDLEQLANVMESQSGSRKREFAIFVGNLRSTAAHVRSRWS